MADIDPNILIPAIAGIAGALVGAIASFIPAYWTERHKHKREAALVEASLIAEIKALVEVAEARQYEQVLQQVCDYLQSQPPGTMFPVTVKVPQEYSRIYQSLAHQIGVVRPQIAAEIVRFHQLMDAVAADVRPGGALSEGAPLDSYQQTLSIFKQAMQVGKSLART